MKLSLLNSIGGTIFAVGAVWLFFALGLQPAIAILLTLLGLMIQYFSKENERKNRLPDLTGYLFDIRELLTTDWRHPLSYPPLLAAQI
jgi:uncharacterized membrane protein